MDDILGEILVSFLLGRGVGSDGMSQYGLMGQVGTGGDTLLADTQLACQLAFAFLRGAICFMGRRVWRWYVQTGGVRR